MYTENIDLNTVYACFLFRHDRPVIVPASWALETNGLVLLSGTIQTFLI